MPLQPLKIEPKNHSYEHIKKMVFEKGPEQYLGGWICEHDSNLNPPEEFDKAELRVLCCFLSDGPSRAVASTDAVLHNLIKHEFGSRVFIDFCYFPHHKNYWWYNEYHVPFLFGSTSHHSVKDYDALFCSASVLVERINYIWYLLHSDIPLSYASRLKDPSVPLILFGGIGADSVECFLGSEHDQGERSPCMIDGVFMGQAEGMLDNICYRLMAHKKEGSLRNDKHKVLVDFAANSKHFYFPMAYKEHYKDAWRIERIEKMIPEALDVIRPNWVRNLDEYPGFEQKILHSAGGIALESADIEVSMGCSSGGSCSFCREAHAVGGWREKSLERVEQEVKTVKANSLANALAFYSFNTGYYSQYLNLLYIAACNFSTISAMGLRADVIATRPDYFDLDRTLGKARTTFGLEGISDRIRNGYLNKNLSFESFRDACKTVFRNRFMEVKIYLINTGMETTEDFQEFYDNMKEIRDLRDEMGAGTSIRLAITTLCYYPKTPLQWEPRKSMLNLFYRNYHFREMIALFQNGLSEIRIAFTNRGICQVQSQLCLDLGRKITPYLITLVKEYSTSYTRVISNKSTEILVDLLKEDGIILEDVFSAKGRDHIFPGAMIQDLNEDYMDRAAKKVEAMEPLPYCLSAPPNPDGRECHNCGYCETKEEKQHHLCRKFSEDHIWEDIAVKLANRKPKYCWRVGLDVPVKYRFLQKHKILTYYMSRIIRENPKWVDSFYSTGTCSAEWMSMARQQEQVSGLVLMDFNFESEIDPEEFERVRKRIAPEIRTGKWVGYSEVLMDRPLLSSNQAVYVIYTKKPLSFVMNAVQDFGGVVRVVIKGPKGNILKKKNFSLEIPQPIVFRDGQCAGMVVSLPLKINPHQFVYSLFKGSHKKNFSDFLVKCIFYWKPSDQFDSSGEPCCFDLFRSRPLLYGNTILRKAIAEREQS